eukprot:361578-Chlamydomonas_euryale.AAC.3
MAVFPFLPSAAFRAFSRQGPFLTYHYGHGCGFLKTRTVFDVPPWPWIWLAIFGIIPKMAKPGKLRTPTNWASVRWTRRCADQFLSQTWTWTTFRCSGQPTQRDVQMFRSANTAMVRYHRVSYTTSDKLQRRSLDGAWIMGD